MKIRKVKKIAIGTGKNGIYMAKFILALILLSAVYLIVITIVVGQIGIFVNTNAIRR